MDKIIKWVVVIRYHPTLVILDMEKLLKRILNVSIGDFINFCCFLVSVGLLIGGFFAPPLGVIDNSLLIGVGELGFFASVTRIPELVRSLKNGASVDVSIGDKKVHIEGADEEDNNN